MGDWKEHTGGECPTHPNRSGDNIEVELRYGAVRKTYPHSVIWRHANKEDDTSGDIIRWRYSEASPQ